jgi:branched-chain amino acid transport system permease protein
MIPDMTVLENVALGAHTRGNKGVLAAMLRSNRQEEQRLFKEAQRQLERIGMGAYLHEQAGNLSMGPQRLMEIARALCADPALLLLDEPAAGLRHKEKVALGQAQELGQLWVQGWPPEGRQRLLQRLKAVTPEQVRSVAARYFKDDQMTAGLLLPEVAP